MTNLNSAALHQSKISATFSSDGALSILDRLQNSEALLNTIWAPLRIIDELSWVNCILLSRRGLKIYKKSPSIKLWPPILASKILIPHHRYTLPPAQAKSVSVFLNKINYLWSSCDFYILVIKNLMTPYFSFQNLWPLVYLGPPYSEENVAP